MPSLFKYLELQKIFFVGNRNYVMYGVYNDIYNLGHHLTN